MEGAPPARQDAAPVRLAPDDALWERVFGVAPLALVTTKEGPGWDVAPKHMAMPLGLHGYYAFACTPRHATYGNLMLHPWFTVSFPGPEQVVASSLAAGGRARDGSKPSLADVPTVAAREVDGRVVAGCPLTLECALERIVDGFGDSSLIVGRIVAGFAHHALLRGAEVDDADLVHRVGLLAYLHPGRFAVVRETHAFPFTSDFHP